MPVSEVLMSPGSWSITLSPDTPRTIIDNLTYFQHVVVSTGRHNPALEGSSLFNSGRYTGVITGLDFQSLNQGRGPVISGDGMATWLGNGSGVGPVIEGNNTPGSSGNGAAFTSASFSTVVSTITPTSVKIGTVYPMPSSAATYTGTFIWQLPSKALTSFAFQVTQGHLPTQIAEWRVNNNATLDFGPVASLYRTTPIVAIISRQAGLDMTVRGLDGTAELIEDVKDYTTRVVVLASGTGFSTAVGVANSSDVGAANPYTDFYGNPVQMTRMVSAGSVSSLNATVSAQAALVPYTIPSDQIRLSSSEYDIKGDLQVGDYIWLYDPDAGFVDTSGVNEIVFRGQRINPTKQRVIQADWPVTSDMTVAYRDQNGVWYDLTDYVIFEDGNATNLIVGGYNRNLIPTSEPVGPRPQPNTTTPGVPVFGAFSSTAYQGSSDGRTKSQVQATWSTPLNTDGTVMTDLGHYEIQYRPNQTLYAINPSYNSLNASNYTYNVLNSSGGTYASIIPHAVANSNWKVTFVAGGTNQVLIQELTPAISYDFQIRAVDVADPPNAGAWSPTTTFQAQYDTIPPPTPDAVTVASNLVAVQITWDCGRASGGTFNQAVDLHHIEVHGSYDPLFTPTAATKLGNVQANIGNITGGIPVVASFTLPPTFPPANTMFIKIIAVDEAGNKSNPSLSAGSTATLWSNAYITDLSVSKLTAGTVTASIILGGVIETGVTGQRVAMDSTGIHAYDGSGNLRFDLNNSTSVLTLSSTAGGHQVTLDAGGTYPVLKLFDAPGTNFAFINAVNLNGNTAGIGVNSGSYVSGGTTYYNRLYMSNQIVLQVVDQSNQGGDGGYVQLTPTQAVLGMNVAGMTNPAQFYLNYNSGNSDGYYVLEGYQPNGSSSSRSGLFSGAQTGISSAATTLTVTFGATAVSNISVVANAVQTGAGVQALNLSSGLGTTSFAVKIAAAYASSWQVNWIATRIR